MVDPIKFNANAGYGVPYDLSKVELGETYNLHGITDITITAVAYSQTTVSKSAGTNAPITDRLPFHLGFFNHTSGLFKLIIAMDFDPSEDSKAIILDVPTSSTTVEHYVILGYPYLDTVSRDIVSFLHIDVTSPQIKKHNTTLGELALYIRWNPKDHDRPLSGRIDKTANVIYGTSIDTGDIPLSYTYVEGRKVYKACILGTITSANDAWRSLCDTIIAMGENDIIILYISSGGGDTQTASSLIAAMDMTKGKVVTVACGACASAAPVIWSKGHIRILTDNASMMVHSMAIMDPSTKTTGQLAECGDFFVYVTYEFLKSTVGYVGLATDDEISKVIRSSKEYYHSALETQKRTQAPVIQSDRDLWDIIRKDLNRG